MTIREERKGEEKEGGQRKGREQRKKTHLVSLMNMLDVSEEYRNVITSICLPYLSDT